MKQYTKMLLASIAGAVCFASSSLAQTEVRISTAAPGGAPLTAVLEEIVAGMNEAFPNEVDFSLHHSSTLFKQGTELPALQRGTLEMSTPVTFEIEQQLPEYGVMGAAYLFRDADHMVSTYAGEVGDQFRADVTEEMGVTIVGVAYLGTRTVNLREAREVTQPSDLNGIKMRMPPGPAFQTLASALGATPVSMPITEVYLALKTGAIDAQDNPTNLTKLFKFTEVSEQVILTKHLVQPVFIAMATPIYESLSDDQRAKLHEITDAAVAEQIAKSVADEAVALEEFRASDIIVTEVDTELFRAAVWDEYKNIGAMDDWMPGLADKILAIE